MRNKSKLKPILIGGLFIILVVGLLITIVSQQSTLKERSELLEELRTQQTELKQRIDALESEISYMGTDEYVERTARDRLGMVKEGEIVFKDNQAEGEDVADGG